MQTSLTDFRAQYQELLQNFLWRQWDALGVAGTTQSDDTWVIDPEALLIFTATMGRHDARLFDEMIDWLHKNGEFLNIQRLKRIIKTERFAGTQTLQAIAGLLAKGDNVLKWKSLATKENNVSETIPLFYLKDGTPIPNWGTPDPHFESYGFLRGRMELRGYSKVFRPNITTNLILQLRSLVGPNTRCEILAYLLTHNDAHPSELGRETFHRQRAVQEMMVDMAASGIIHTRTKGREKLYWLQQKNWIQLLNREDQMPCWITWAPLFSALERIWMKLNEPRLLAETEKLFAASELRQLMIDVKPDIERAGFAQALSDDRLYHGEEYFDVFLADIKRLLG